MNRICLLASVIIRNSVLLQFVDFVNMKGKTADLFVPYDQRGFDWWCNTRSDIASRSRYQPLSQLESTKEYKIS